MFQSDRPQLFQLKNEVGVLCKSMCTDFMTLAYVCDNDFSMISPNDKSHHVPLTDVYVGIKVSDSIQEKEANLGNDNPVFPVFL